MLGDRTYDLHSYHFLIHSTITHLAGGRLIRLSECMLQHSHSVSVAVSMEWPQEHQFGDPPRTAPCSGYFIISDTTPGSHSTSFNSNPLYLPLFKFVKNPRRIAKRCHIANYSHYGYFNKNNVGARVRC